MFNINEYDQDDFKEVNLKVYNSEEERYKEVNIKITKYNINWLRTSRS